MISDEKGLQTPSTSIGDGEGGVETRLTSDRKSDYGSFDQKIATFGSKNSSVENFDMMITLSRLNVFSRGVTGFYLFLIAAIVGFLVVGFAHFLEIDICLAAIIALTVIGSILGAIGVYKFGTINSEINKLKEENNEYENSINEMHNNVDKLSNTVGDINTQVKNLTNDAKELEEHLKQFDSLRNELSKISDKGDDINKAVTSLNDLCKDMEKIVIENERAALLEQYYDVELNDRTKGLSEREYGRFLARLTEKQRKRFEEIGNFNDIAGEDNVIDLNEFQLALQQVLDQMEGEAVAAMTS